MSSTIVCICHGLNNISSSFNDIFSVFKSNNIPAFKITLPGHDELNDPTKLHEMGLMWEQHLQQSVEEVLDKYEHIKFIGYSFGALIITAMLIKNEHIRAKTTGLTLMSPALELTLPSIITKEIYSRMPAKSMVSSQAPKAIRANKNIPASWYRQLATLHSFVNSHSLDKIFEHMHVDIVMDKRDELTSYRKLKKRFGNNKFKNINMIEIKSKHLIKHLMFNKNALNDQEWAKLEKILLKI